MRSRSSSRERSPEQNRLPNGVSQISESDYFLKSDEFIVWLKDEKNKYFDELTSEKSHKYFRRFVKAWNKGRLPKSLYSGVERSSQPRTTAYKWSFVSKASRADTEALKAVRDSVGSATFGPSSSISADQSSTRPKIHGPTLPSHSDTVLAREEEAERQAVERQNKRKRERMEDKDRIEDVVGPREVGREAMLEKKRLKRDGDRAFREKGDDGFMEADEGTLMGGGNDFKAQIARRDANRQKWQDKRNAERGEKTAAVQDRRSAMQDRDKANMEMFMKMAKEKFG